LQQQLAALQAENRDYKDRMQELTRDLLNPAIIRQRQQQATQPPAVQQPVAQPVQAPVPVPEFDYDNSTPQQLVEHINKLVDQKLEQRLAKTEQTAADTARQVELQDTQRKYPDFWLYGQAMVKIAQDREARGQYISAEDCYLIAKAQQSLRPTTQRQTAQPNAATPVAPPRRQPAAAERPGASPQSTSPTKVSLRDAMEQAWEQTMGRRGD
jgi:hypothetical protein